MGNHWKPCRPFDKEKFADSLWRALGSSTQHDFAEKCGVSFSYITKLLNERQDAPPTPKIIRKIASAAANKTAYCDLLSAAGYDAEYFNNLDNEENDQAPAVSSSDFTDTCAYVQAELQKQAVDIAKRIFMTTSALRIQDVMYVTGLSRDVAEEIFAECERRDKRP